MGTDYESLDGLEVRKPVQASNWPSPAHLTEHARLAQEKHGTPSRNSSIRTEVGHRRRGLLTSHPPLPCGLAGLNLNGRWFPFVLPFIINPRSTPRKTGLYPKFRSLCRVRKWILEGTAISWLGILQAQAPPTAYNRHQRLTVNTLLEIPQQYSLPFHEFRSFFLPIKPAHHSPMMGINLGAHL